MDDSDDENIWAYVTKDVKPITRDKPLQDQKPKKPPSPAQERSKPCVIEPLPASPRYPVRATQPDELDKRTAQRLRKGQIPIEARIDLHGMSQHQAQPALEAFIAYAQGSGYRCVLVITGKGERGQGVLRRAVPEWLSHMNGILKVYEAQPKDGGFGALYVYLKRQR